MKKLKTKLFISLWLVATAIIACFVAAYTINIGNQESYGTLNLNKLILRNSGWGTWIVLDGTEYVIKIWENAGSDEYSKLRVAYICERNWQYCKTIAQLAQDNDSSNVLKILWSWTQAVSFNQKEDATLNIVGSDATTVEATDWKIIISSTDNDTRNANTLNVPGYVAAPTWGTSRKVRKTNNDGYPSRLDDADTHYTSVLKIQWSGTDAIQFDQANGSTLNIVGSGNTKVSATSGQITIYSTGWGGGWDSHWTKWTNGRLSPNGNEDLEFTGWTNLYRMWALYIKSTEPWKSNSKITFSNQWLKIGEGRVLWTNNVSLDVAWEIVIWNSGTSNNFIRLYTTWNANPHNWSVQEIMANKGLDIWVYSGAYMSFRTINSALGTWHEFRIWINTPTPQATLDVEWSIRMAPVGTCFPDCSTNTAWSIIYNGGYFYWCDWTSRKKLAYGTGNYNMPAVTCSSASLNNEIK